MNLQHIVVAVDQSGAGRSALRTALDLARRASARVTAFRAISCSRVTARALAGSAEPPDAALDELTRWLAEAGAEASKARIEIAYGSPGIEIPRYMELRGADLIVLGRKPDQTKDRLLGGTADSVVRRSRLPCLFVPPDGPPIRRILVAADGTPRGRVVTAVASRLAQSIGAALHVVTVRRFPGDEFSEPVRPRATANSGVDLKVRHGEVVEQVMAEVRESHPDVVAIGYHRGGVPIDCTLGGPLPDWRTRPRASYSPSHSNSIWPGALYDGQRGHAGARSPAHRGDHDPRTVRGTSGALALLDSDRPAAARRCL